MSYPKPPLQGYFPVGDTAGLARLLSRIESDPEYLKRLKRAITRRGYLFRPVRERAAWRGLIVEAVHSRIQA
jgi:hypothetical protein